MTTNENQLPPKVLQFSCPSGFYGAERWIIALAKNLSDEVVVCSLVVIAEPGDTRQELALEFRKLNKNVNSIVANGRFDFSIIWQLVKLIRSENIDIIHSHGYKSDILGLIAARICRIHAVTTPHGFVGLNDWKLKLYYGVGNRFFRWFDKVVPLSQQLCRDILQLGVKKKNMRYIQNGVDLDEIDSLDMDPYDDTAKTDGLKRIGFIGQITQRKNIVHILNVFDKLYTKHQRVELVLLGDGDQFIEMQEYANTLPSSDAIKFLGFQQNRLNWLKSMDLFVMTSKLEGIPRCLMEAMAMKIPVAAYQIPGVDQLVTHEKTGLLAVYGDQDSLEHYWERLLFDENLANSLSEAGRQFILENFSAKRMAEEYTGLFRTLTELR